MLTLLLSLALTGPTLAATPGATSATAAAAIYKYAGADGAQKDLSVADIVAAVRANRTGQHYVWQAGWAAWKSWQDVPELKAAVDAADSAEAAEAAKSMSATRPAAADPVISYSAGGPPEQLTASEIARRVAANPTAQHLAWKPGMAAWVPAKEMPEVATAMAADSAASAPPPPVTPAGPPPPPSAGGMEPMATTGGEAEEDDDEDEAGEGCGMCAVNVHVGADLRANLSMLNLGGAIEDNPETGIRGEVTRARPYVVTHLGEHVGAKVALDAAQVDDRSANTAGLSGVANGWALTVPEGFVEVKAGDKVQLSAKLGAQEVAFGVNGYFNDYGNYYIGGHSAWSSLQQRPEFAILPEYDLGVGLRLAGTDKWAVDAQFLNGTGVESVEDNYGKNWLGRASIHPVDPLRVWVSGSYQTKEVDDSVTAYAFSGAAEFRHKYVGILGEAHYGGEGTDGVGYPTFGYQVGLAGHLPLGGDVIQELSPVFTFQGYDPTLGGVSGTPEAYDGGYAPTFGLNAYWKVGDGRTALTGLAYEGYIPVNADLPIVNSIVLQSAVKF